MVASRAGGGAEYFILHINIVLQQKKRRNERRSTLAVGKSRDVLELAQSSDVSYTDGGSCCRGCYVPAVLRFPPID